MRVGLRIGLCWTCAIALFASVSSGAPAFETRTYPAFVQVNAVVPRDESGFAIVGFARGEEGTIQSAFQNIAANGSPIGRSSVLPLPDSAHSRAWASSLSMLPNGDYVAVGWAEDLRGKPDGWLTRITRDGDIVWNLAAVHDQDQRFYSVKRLSNGNLVAVGRVQQGPDSKQSARGYVVVFDQTDGRQIARHEFAFSPNTLRSAFQDVAEMADGSLLFVGWMTKTDGTDDIWLLKTTPDGK